MNKKTSLNRETLSEVRSLKAVKNVTDSGRIFYSESFRKTALKKYKDGVKPVQIFCEAGFPLDVLGIKRIEKCMARWRNCDTPTR